MTEIDLSTALPTTPRAMQGALDTALTALLRSPDLPGDLRANRPAGTARDRAVAVDWLRGRLGPVSQDRVVVTNGTQNAIALVVQAVVPPEGVVVAEEMTYVVLRSIVERLGRRVKAVPIDREGMVPEALDEVCAQHGPSLVFINPTIHNPTTAIASEGRRVRLAAVARKHGVPIFEDDVLGALHPDAPAPIAAVAPDIAWYCMSLSKCLAMGLRMAYLVVPRTLSAADFVRPVGKLSSWFPASLSAQVVEALVRTGGAREISAGIASEMVRRQRLAATMLDGHAFDTKPGALHIWLQLPEAADPASVVAAAASKGVAMRPSDVFLYDGGSAPNAVRISLSAPRTEALLRDGLTRVRSILDPLRRTDDVVGGAAAMG